MAFPLPSGAPCRDSSLPDPQAVTQAGRTGLGTGGGLGKRREMVTLLLALALLGTVAFMACRRQTTRAASPLAEGPHQALRGWRIALHDADPAGQAGGFAGSYRPGEVLFLPPGARFTCRAEPNGVEGGFEAPGAWSAQGGVCPGGTEGRAPERPGLYRLVWHGAAPPDGASLDVLVLGRATLKPQGERTHVNVRGKDLGAYLDPAKSSVERVVEHAARYRPPEYFAALDRQTLDLPVGESLKLGQLVAFMDRRDAEGHKVYTTVRHTDVLPPSRALCEKLSRLYERLRSKGVKLTRFWITSGFRTPDYNRSIGGAAYSRHCYGDAVDLVIDEDGDKRMDDLNGDKKIDRQDGLVIGRACQELEREGLVVPGGIGVYEWDSDDSVRSHVHVDCRGYPVRWGQISRGSKRIGFDWWSESGDTACEAAPE